jgi:hypothetical protein
LTIWKPDYYNPWKLKLRPAMNVNQRKFLLATAAATGAPAVGQSQRAAQKQEPRLELITVEPHPYGVPRPFVGSVDVPIGTSVYLELTVKDSTADDAPDPNSVQVTLTAADGPSQRLVGPGQRFAEGDRGNIAANKVQRALTPTILLSIYIELAQPLAPNLRYTFMPAPRA